MAEAITTLQTRKNSTNHRVLHSLVTIVKELELVGGNSQAIPRLCLLLYAILFEYKILIAIHHQKLRPWPEA